MSTEYVPVNISKKLYDEIQKKVAESHGEFKSVEEYVDFVLTEVIFEEEIKNVSMPEEEKAAKDKLKKLRYL